MVGRVSSFGQQQLLIQGVQQNQRNVFTAQQQITTGKRTDEYRGLAGETGTVLGARSTLSRVETYQQTIDTVGGKLDANDVQLGAAIESVEGLLDQIRLTIANNQAAGFTEQLETTFSFVANGLNTNIDGTFLFSGAETGTQPVNVTNIQDFITLKDGGGTTADAFDNAPIAFQARIADGVDLEFGVLASEIGTDIFEELEALYRADQATPFEGELTDAQRTFLSAQIASIEAAIDGVRQHQVDNGLAQERIKVLDEQHQDTSIFLETFIADIEDVDIAEAVTRLNNDQVALQASYQSIGSLSQLSLLNFL